jgi:hypothetical protein
MGKIMLFSSRCSEIPDVGVFILTFFPSSHEKKIACSPTSQTIKLVWPDLAMHNVIPESVWPVSLNSKLNRAFLYENVWRAENHSLNVNQYPVLW